MSGISQDRFAPTKEFLDAAPTAFHAGSEIARRLERAGFIELKESDRWKLDSGAAYFVRRSLGAVIAFRMGTEAPAEVGAVIAGAHTDSPALKLKLESERVVDGVVTVGTEVYGGAIVSTWFDRDLEIAGVAALRRGDKVAMRLVRLSSLTGVIPNAAIHLNRKVNESFEYSRQDHLRCILGSADEGMDEKAPGVIRAAVAEELGVPAHEIADLDLFLTDSAPAVRIGRGGAGAGDWFAARHIDNLLGCSTILDAICASEATAWLQVAVFFDNEEIGSRSHAGAQSGFLDRVLDRIVWASGGTSEDGYRIRAKSFLLSNDAGHGGHPNFRDKYDPAYLPRLGGGPVIKVHAGLSYTSLADTAAHFRKACEASGVPCQRFANRSDGRSGSTIGPLIQTRSDLRSVDVGIPILAMHSVRETAAVADIDLMTRAIEALYRLGPLQLEVS